MKPSNCKNGRSTVPICRAELFRFEGVRVERAQGIARVVMPLPVCSAPVAARGRRTAPSLPTLICQLLACVVLLMACANLPAETPASKTKLFPHPDRIRYDGHCLTIEGKDVFIRSAEFHYFRTPRELWRDRFQKIK